VDRKTNPKTARKHKGLDVNWEEATSYCQQLRLGGFSDLRLAQIGELEGIFDVSVDQPYKVKGGIQLSSYWVWSATPAGSGEAWSFEFYHDGGEHPAASISAASGGLCVCAVPESDLVILFFPSFRSRRDGRRCYAKLQSSLVHCNNSGFFPHRTSGPAGPH
jgi:hypothetical protein